MKLKELAQLIQGEVQGDGSVEIQGVAQIQKATQGDMAFIEKKEDFSFLEKSQAAAVMVPERLKSSKNLVIVKNPKLAFAKVLDIFYPRKRKPEGISERAEIAASAVLGKEVTVKSSAFLGEKVRIGDRSYIHPGVKILADVVIGEDCEIYPNVVIYEKTSIGNRVIIHANSVLGSDGFGYAEDRENQKNYKIPQVGRVRIEDDVEIGANVAIDRATLDETIIKAGAKIDNLVQIGHNSYVGNNSILCGQVGISGSVSIGANTILAGQVGVADHLKIGNNVKIAAKSGLSKNVKDGDIVAGCPAQNYKQFLRQLMVLKKLSAQKD